MSEETKSFGCTKCNKQFARKSDLTKHQNRKIACDSIKSAKTKKVKIPKALKTAIWNRDFPNIKQGKCYTCERIVYDDDFQAAHIIPESKGGTIDIDNLKVSCKACNTSCGTKNLHEFNAMLKPKHNAIPKTNTAKPNNGDSQFKSRVLPGGITEFQGSDGRKVYIGF
jgi:5-methylcytosine-specific restriction endonuclease McrA